MDHAFICDAVRTPVGRYGGSLASIRTDDLLKRWFSRTLIVHIVLSIMLYSLLVAHITSGIYFGLRWLR